MGARLRSWRQQIKKHRVAIRVIVIVLEVVITLIIAGYWFDWTGFNGYNKVTIAHTISGTNAGTVIRTEEYQPGRTLWDWMQLLIIPAVLAVGGYVINLTISRGEQEATKQRAKTEQEIASDNQREVALKEYIDQMSELLLKEHLGELKPEYETVRKIARVRTLIVLQRLDPRRKRSLVRFLYESGLIDKDKCIINLRKADLSKVDLCGVDLHGADLHETILNEADMRVVNLFRADLHGAVMVKANLRSANFAQSNLIETILTEANLDGTSFSESDLTGAKVTPDQLKQAQSLKGATMPDGSIYP